MKSRKTTYLLIAAVAIVWGIIAWKLVSPAKRDDVPGQVRRPPPATAVVEADTLWLNYRDPFLGTPVPRAVSVETAVRPLPPVNDPAFVPQERLVYWGRIVKDGRSDYLIGIDERQYMIRRGESAEEYRLAEAWADSVRLVKGNRSVTVRLYE